MKYSPDVFVVRDRRKRPLEARLRTLALYSPFVDGEAEGIHILTIHGQMADLPCDIFADEGEEETFLPNENGFRIVTESGDVELEKLTLANYQREVKNFVHPSWLPEKELKNDKDVQTYWKTWF